MTFEGDGGDGSGGGGGAVAPQLASAQLNEVALFSKFNMNLFRRRLRTRNLQRLHETCFNFVVPSLYIRVVSLREIRNNIKK